MSNVTEACAAIQADQALRPEPNDAYRSFSLFLFIFNLVLWVTCFAFYCVYQNHRRLRVIRPLILNVTFAIGEVIWSTICLNLVIDDLPCVFMPLSIITGMTITSINFYVRLTIFGIESQFAKNAHLFKANKDGDTRSDDSMMVVAPYFRSMYSLFKLTFGLAQLGELDATEIAKAKHSYFSIIMVAMVPGLVTLFILFGLNPDVYLSNCTGCPMTFDVLIGFLIMGCVYAGISARITYVMMMSDFADEHGILSEFKWVWAVCVPMIPVTIFWLVDINNAEYERVFAYEWLFQFSMIGYWWFAVGWQMVVVLRDISQQRKNKLNQEHNSIRFTEEDSHNPGFEAFMVRQLAVENLYFLQDVSSYKRYFMEKNESWRKQKSHKIYSTYIRSGGAMELNITDAMRRRVGQQIAALDGDSELEFVFDAVINEVRNSIVCPLWADFEVKEFKNRAGIKYKGVVSPAKSPQVANTSDYTLRPSTG